MRLRAITVAAIALMAVLGYLAWKNNTQPAAQEGAAPAMPGGEPPAAEAPGDPGIAWDTPAGWSDEGPRPMRLATYSVPGADGGPPAKCAVHYFGPGQGGTPDANLDRWLAEFENARDTRRSKQTVHGLRVHRARARGTYRSHGGAAADAHGGAAAESTATPDQELLGAIVEAPEGLVFFKLTGSVATIAAAADDFDRMIGSLRRK